MHLTGFNAAIKIAINMRRPGRVFGPTRFALSRARQLYQQCSGAGGGRAPAFSMLVARMIKEKVGRNYVDILTDNIFYRYPNASTGEEQRSLKAQAAMSRAVP